MDNRLFRPLLLFAFTAGFNGCITETNENVAGVDDFPNSVYASETGFVNESQQAGASQIVPSGAQNLLQPDSSTTVAAKVVAGKFAETGAVAWTSATVKTLRDSITQDSIGVEYDTVQGLGSLGQSPITLIKTVKVYNSGRMVIILQTDADGDGDVTVHSPSSKVHKVIFDSDTGVVKMTDLVIGPGPDTNLATESDNVIYSASWTKTRGADTMVVASYAGTTGDSAGIIVNNASPSVVLLDYRELNPASGVAQSHLWMTLRTHYNAANEIMAFSRQQLFTSGRVTNTLFMNPEGGFNVDHRDTMVVRAVTRGAGADTLDSVVVESRVNRGGTYDRQDNDRIQSFTLTEFHRKGEQIRSQLVFTATVPYVPGTVPVNGLISLELDYTDGTSILLTGTLTGGALSAEVKNRANRYFQVSWDLQGNIIGNVIEKNI